MRMRKIITRSRVTRIGAALAMSAAAVLTTASPSYAAAGTMTLSSAQGPIGGTNHLVVTLSGATAPNPTTFTGSHVAQFSVTTCSDTFTADTAITATASALTAGRVSASTVSLISTTKLDILVPSTLVIPVGGPTTGAFFVCVYADDDPGVSLLVGKTATAAYTIAPFKPSVGSGPSGGGNSVVLTTGAGTFGTAVTTAVVEFQYVGATGGCSAYYQSAVTPAGAGTPVVQTAGVVTVPGASETVNSTTRLTFTVPNTLTLLPNQTSALYNICVYNGATAGTSVLISGTSTPYQLVGQSVTLSVAKGPSGGGNAITLTASGDTFVEGSIGVEFQYVLPGAGGVCSATYANAANPTGAGNPAVQTAGIVQVTGADDLRVLSPTTLVVTVPALLALIANQTLADYNVCVYDGTTVNTSALIAAAPGPYTIAASATIISVSPTAGSAQGGTIVTVYGTNFTSGMTASIGGVAMEVLSVAGNGQSFTGRAPAHSAGGPFAISVTTPGGTKTQPNLFTFTNGITATPISAPNDKATGVNLYVRGVDFDALVFTNTKGNTPNHASAHVYLVAGEYDATASAGSKTNGGVVECVNVIVLSPTELVCKLRLVSSLTPAGTPNVTSRVISDASATNNDGAKTITVAGANFSTADIGKTIVGATIPANTTITGVNSLTTAVLSDAPGSVAGSNLTIGDAAGTVDSVTISSQLTTGQILATASASTFSAADIGRTVSGPNIQAGTVITAVHTDGSTATLSAAATGNTGTALTLTNSTPVPVGTYTITIVNDGAVAADASASFLKSIICSGSTFTVADY
jgi:hypothetical protein